MKTKELQNSIVQKVWQTDDKQFLNYLNKLLIERDKNKKYRLSDFEKSLISDCKVDYLSERTMTNEHFI
ncbi:MAG TPA: hypothetical protein VFC67_03275 [Prolixibacteraceae bacterium]|nr:hypothetical protein [Prolixibacteraceae bacterium]